MDPFPGIDVIYETDDDSCLKSSAEDGVSCDPNEEYISVVGTTPNGLSDTSTDENRGGGVLFTLLVREVEPVFGIRQELSAGVVAFIDMPSNVAVIEENIEDVWSNFDDCDVASDIGTGPKYTGLDAGRADGVISLSSFTEVSGTVLCLCSPAEDTL